MSDKTRITRQQTSLPSCCICLSSIRIQGHINCCQHFFCYQCIEEWSKIENTCPVCKRRFIRITEKKNGVTYRARSKKQKPRIANVQTKDQEERNLRIVFSDFSENWADQVSSDLMILNQLVFQGLQEMDFELLSWPDQ